jgi:hypothetical protein
MMAIFAAAMPAILAILGFILDRISASIATKKAFLQMVEGLGKEGLVSVKLHQSYEEQRRRLESAELL